MIQRLRELLVRPQRASDLFVDQVRAATDESRALFEAYLAGDEPAAIPGHEHLLAHVAGWTMFIGTGVEAVRSLQDAGLGVHAHPIRRNLSEHAITCHVVASEPDSFEALLRGMQRSAKRHLDAATRAGIVSEELENGVRQILEWETDDSTKSLDLLNLAKEKFARLAGGGDALYVQWLKDTALSHANPGSASVFLKPTPGSDYPTLTRTPQVLDETWFVEASCADALTLALDSLSSITVGDPLRERITDLNMRRNVLYAEAEEPA